MYSANFEALTENPPPKSPYFTLPDICYLTEPIHKPSKRVPGGNSIVKLWGSTKMSEEHTTDFLLELLKFSEWEPDFQAVANEWGVDSYKTVKNRFKSIVESRKYALDDDMKVSGGSGPPKPEPATPKKRKKSDSNATAETEPAEAEAALKKQKPAKKRKTDTNDEPIPVPRKRKKSKVDATSDNVEQVEVDVEVPQLPKKKRAKKSKDNSDVATPVEHDQVKSAGAAKEKKCNKSKDVSNNTAFTDDDNRALPEVAEERPLEEITDVADVIESVETIEAGNVDPAGAEDSIEQAETQDKEILQGIPEVVVLSSRHIDQAEITKLEEPASQETSLANLVSGDKEVASIGN